jgi:hypothetical protein
MREKCISMTENMSNDNVKNKKNQINTKFNVDIY